MIWCWGSPMEGIVNVQLVHYSEEVASQGISLDAAVFQKNQNSMVPKSFSLVGEKHGIFWMCEIGRICLHEFIFHFDLLFSLLFSSRESSSLLIWIPSPRGSSSGRQVVSCFQFFFFFAGNIYDQVESDGSWHKQSEPAASSRKVCSYLFNLQIINKETKKTNNI